MVAHKPFPNAFQTRLVIDHVFLDGCALSLDVSRYRAHASRGLRGLRPPSAPLRRLRDIFLVAQPPLLWEEGSSTYSPVIGLNSYLIS